MPVVTFTCDGAPVRVPVWDEERRLETLRGRLGLTSVKDGCRPEGQCGACLAIVTGHARVTCTEPTRAEIARGLDMHLCRCGGRGRIVTAMENLELPCRVPAWDDAIAAFNDDVRAAGAAA